MINRIAVSLALPDTDSCLVALHELNPNIGMAEIRLDLMDSFDLPRLINEAPCRLIITCRPSREGGHFGGSEKERLEILAQAVNLGCDFVDVEWDCVETLNRLIPTGARVIVSRHWTDEMPPTLWPDFEALQAKAYAVKLVGYAHRLADVLPVLNLLSRATKPVIGLAMGEAGRITRLLAPCFTHCLLTYAAISPEAVTAPGQLSVCEMSEIYQMQKVGTHTKVHLHLCFSPESVASIKEKNLSAAPGKALYVSVVAPPEDAEKIIPGLLVYIPKLLLTIDPKLASLLPELKQSPPGH